MDATQTLIEARPQIAAATPGMGELHIADLSTPDVALCGFRRRARPVHLSWQPDREATCAVCLDLYAVEVSDA